MIKGIRLVNLVDGSAVLRPIAPGHVVGMRYDIIEITAPDGNATSYAMWDRGGRWYLLDDEGSYNPRTSDGYTNIEFITE